MHDIETYTEIVIRHAAELEQRKLVDRQLLALTCRIFINGGAIDKHPDATVISSKHGVPQSLLWRGDVVAEQNSPGMIHLSRYSYPVTPVLEGELRQKGWVKIERVNASEHAWISRPRLGDIVRNFLKEVHRGDHDDD